MQQFDLMCFDLVSNLIQQAERTPSTSVSQHKPNDGGHPDGDGKENGDECGKCGENAIRCSGCSRVFQKDCVRKNKEADYVCETCDDDED